ncbi:MULTISPECIES: ABC transporter substrate-binding protein [Nesterenkonia]|uniref:Thiamine pyrimidine synthase n=2 Tax=Nesterenkonia TaxID=57494 RepID=A0A839FTD6_9MICC|nr:MULTISPECIES: ABC transporter substrate-binding protein [Nesterenkonia]MBA8921552.1 ABC-type nitrate/sulfonate/bicarbonate transport system substrate-binding protein [Nesterenkonia jeotgali]NYJ16876.1 ABC-type nitrate/sulfonate/bicarbonate transport system substrate-binding protein [Nesterenkonia sandarakina]
MKNPVHSRGLKLTTFSAVALLALTSCGGDDSASADSGEDASYGDINIALSWVENAEFAGEFFAQENGYYEEAGFETVEFIPGPGPIENMVASGEATFGTSNAVATGEIIAEEDAPLKIVGAKYQRNPFTILSLADEGNIASPEDLEGKTIGVQAGGNEALFEALLEVNDIDPDSVEMVPVEYDPAPLLDGEVDGFFAYVINESITVELMGHEVTDLMLSENGLPFVAEALITSEEMIEEEPELIKSFLEAELQGWQDAVSDPEEGARLAVEEYGAHLDLEMDKELRQAEVQVDLVVTDEVRENGLLTISEDLQAESVDSLERAGVDVTAEELFDLSLLSELLEEKPELAEIPDGV